MNFRSGTTYGELFPVIEVGRLDVMVKLMQIVNQMDEIEEEMRKAGFSNRECLAAFPFPP